MGSVERPIRGDGSTPEPHWRRWLAQRQVLPLATDTLLHPGRRLVVVAPHPDDEILACGGLLALHAGPIAILAVTDGEASHRGDDGWSAAGLAAARRRESERGLAQLGVAPAAVTRLGLPDGDVAGHRLALEAALRHRLRDDDVVVTTWRFDGHPDHEATGAAVARACGRLGCRLLEAPVWMWHWGAPGDPRVPWDKLRALPLPAEACARKDRALAEHATQRSPRGAAGPVLGAAILARAARDAEYFFE